MEGSELYILVLTGVALVQTLEQFTKSVTAIDGSGNSPGGVKAAWEAQM